MNLFIVPTVQHNNQPFIQQSSFPLTGSWVGVRGTPGPFGWEYKTPAHQSPTKPNGPHLTGEDPIVIVMFGFVCIVLYAVRISLAQYAALVIYISCRNPSQDYIFKIKSLCLCACGRWQTHTHTETETHVLTFDWILFLSSKGHEGMTNRSQYPELTVVFT